MRFRIFCYMRMLNYYDTGGLIIPFVIGSGTVATVVTL